MKKIKIFLIILCSLLFLNSYYISHGSLNIETSISTSGGNNSNNGKIKNGILDGVKQESLVTNTGEKSIGGFFKFIKDQIFKIIAVLAIAMIIWIGIRIAAARGNPEEFKKAWIHFIYLILGLFIIFASWGIVKIIVSFKDIF